jgi:hypothetical protein
VLASAAGAPNGRGQKRDNTKQTTLFGLPAVPPVDRPEKRSRKKGGAVPSEEDSRVAEPETMESQDVEMAELQDAAATQSTQMSQGATATAVEQESQATEVITTQVERVSPVHTVLMLTTMCRKVAVLNLSIGPQRHHQWIITSQMRYVLTECRTAPSRTPILCFHPPNRRVATFILPFHQIEHEILVPLVGDERVYIQFLCERGQGIQFTT